MCTQQNSFLQQGLQQQLAQSPALVCSHNTYTMQMTFIKDDLEFSKTEQPGLALNPIVFKYPALMC